MIFISERAKERVLEMQEQEELGEDFFVRVAVRDYLIS